MENITNVLVNGLKSIKNNKVLFVPALILILIGLISQAVRNISFAYLGNIWIILYFCSTLLVFIISTYITTGHIGMSKEAISTGKTSMNHLTSYGNRYFGRMLMANIILGLIQAVALIFWIPVLYVIYNSGLSDTVMNMGGSPEEILAFADSLFALFATLIIPIAIGFILTIIYEFIVFVLFFFVGYNIVIDDLSVIGSFKNSLSLLKAKFFQVLLFIGVLIIVTLITFFFVLIALVIFMFIIGFILGILSIIVPIFATIVPIFSTILGLLVGLVIGTIFSTLFTVWIARFYMSITEKPLYVEEKITNY
ncbi:MAG: hypothetical protein FWH46_04335 [Methanimicrococcus sp.]|nr:hypothetical protein [Methanimicrococcus sp.]